MSNLLLITTGNELYRPASALEEDPARGIFFVNRAQAFLVCTSSYPNVLVMTVRFLYRIIYIYIIIKIYLKKILRYL